jgi:ribonuclease Z
MKLPRIFALVALVVVLAAAGAWLMRGQIALALYARMMDRNFAGDPIAALPDGLHVGLCGAGSPMPDPGRAGPCTVVVAGKRLFVVDTGEGSPKNLSLMGLPPGRVEAVFLTHFHSDHIADLGELMLQHWGGGAATAPLPIHGPQGVDQVVAGFQSAYVLDRGYRIAHHGEKIMPPAGFGAVAEPFQIAPDGPDVTLIDEPDLKVVAFPVPHHPADPAVGYLFVYKGRRLVISGDTAASARLEAEAKDADVLVHEALSPKLVGILHEAALKTGRANVAAITHDILSYHTTPEQAAAIAERAHVRYLLYTHIIPPLPISALEGPFVGDARRIFHGPLRVGRDGDFISMPAGSKEISRSNRLQARL